MAELTLRPNGAGDHTDLSGSGGSGANWERVSDENDDSGVSNNYNGTTKYDLYETENPGVSGTINKITIYNRGKNLTTPYIYGYVTPLLKIGGNEYRGTEQAMSYFLTNYSHEWENNPDDSLPWEFTDIESLQIGVELRYQSNKPYCVEVWVVVDYAPSVSYVDIAGSFDGLSSLSGIIKRLFSIEGTIASISTSSGKIVALKDIIGSISSQSALSGSVVIVFDATGSIDSLSSINGAIIRIENVSGLVSALSSVSGNTTFIRNLSGLISALSSISGNIVLNIVKISGVINSVSTLDAVAKRLRKAEGIVAGQSGVDGVIHLIFGASGEINAVSNFIASLQRTMPVSGLISAQSNVWGNLPQPYPEGFKRVIVLIRDRK